LSAGYGTPAINHRYAPDRHAALQNGLSIRTQLLGLLNPVIRPERFRDARGGLRLELDDVYSVGEEIPATVVSATRRDTLVASVTDVATGRPLMGPLPLRPHDDELTHSVEIGPLPGGCYRLEVTPAGGSARTAQPVHGLFLVVGDDEPA
jgi:hypothetical protein